MRKLVDLIRQSFSARLSIWVVLFATIILLVAQLVLGMAARRIVREQAIDGATRTLENAALRLEEIQEDVKIEADHAEWLVYRHLDEPDAIMEYARNTLYGNAFLNGCSISFEPGVVQGQTYFSAYASRVGDEVHSEQEGNDEYRYFYKDWYLMPKLLNQPCWTEPYSDWDSDDNTRLETYALISYCKPLTDVDGNFIGAISLDVSIPWLSQTISSVKPYPHSYNMLISRSGTYMVHPDPEKLFYQSVFSGDLTGTDPQLSELGRAMTGWEEGMWKVEIGGKRNYVFFRPIRETGWSMAIVCPESDIFGQFKALRWLSVALALLGLLLMFLGCYYVIHRTVKPLRTLAAQAGRIASGDFDTILPDDGRVDEIGTLSQSFSHMQTSLVSYINELTRSTEKRVRIEGELQIARDIQMGMVPRVFPAFPERKEVDLFASIRPAKEVGGDLYDFFIRQDRLYFCIGDVSGKGIPASLFMAVARNLFRVLGQQDLPVHEIACQVNDTLSQGNEQLMFVTLFIGIVDLASGHLSFCNCGHNPPLLLRKDGPVFLDCIPNSALGVCSGLSFQEQELADIKGMPLFLYTDGLNEAENMDQEQFGADRILSVAGSKAFKDAEEFVLRMEGEVDRHVGAAEASDDLTMLCLRVG